MPANAPASIDEPVQTPSNRSEPTPQTASKGLYLETYGCQMNVADSELITGVLARDGYRRVDDPAQADVVLLNTCAIREHAEQRVAQRVRQLIAERDGGRRLRIGLAGCMAQHHRDRLLDAAAGAASPSVIPTSDGRMSVVATSPSDCSSSSCVAPTSSGRCRSR